MPLRLVLPVLAALTLAAPASAASARCPAGQLAVPAALGKGTVKLSATRSGKGACVAYGAAAADGAEAKLRTYQRRSVARRVPALRKALKTTAAAERATTAAVAHHPSRRQSGVQSQPFVVHQGDTTVSGTETVTPNTPAFVGAGDDAVAATSVTKHGATTVRTTQKVTRSQGADSCPSADGVVTGEATVKVVTTTVTTTGDGPALRETSTESVTTDFTAQVGDDAEIQTLTIQRTDEGDSSAEVDAGDGIKGARSEAGHSGHATVTVSGAGAVTGTPTGSVRSTSTARHAGSASALDALADAAALHSVGFGKDDVAALVAAARASWQTANRCAHASYQGDGQTVHLGGTADASAVMHPGGTLTSTRQTDTGSVPSQFTATDACGTVLDHTTVATQNVAAFHETDANRVWQKPLTAGCLALRGTSRVGITTGRLSFPIAALQTFSVYVVADIKHSWTSTSDFVHNPGTASECEDKSMASGTYHIAYSDENHAQAYTTATLSADGKSLDIENGAEAPGTDTLQGTSSGNGCGGPVQSQPTSGCGDREDSMHPVFEEFDAGVFGVSLDFPAPDRANCPGPLDTEDGVDAHAHVVVDVPLNQLADPSQKTVTAHGSDSNTAHDGCGPGECENGTYSADFTDDQEFELIFVRDA